MRQLKVSASPKLIVGIFKRNLAFTTHIIIFLAPIVHTASLPARKGECRIPICNIRAAQRNLSEEIKIFIAAV